MISSVMCTHLHLQNRKKQKYGYARMKIDVSHKSFSVIWKYFWLILRYWHFLSLFQSFWEKSKHSCAVLAIYPKRITSYSICFIRKKLITYKCTQLHLFYSTTVSESVKSFIEGNKITFGKSILGKCFKRANMIS